METLGLFINALAVDHKHSCYKRENFRKIVEIQLFKRLKSFYQFFIAFLESTSNFQHFEKKDESQSSAISESIDSNKRNFLNFLKTLFHNNLQPLTC